MINEFILGDFLQYAESIPTKSVQLTLTGPPDKEETEFKNDKDNLRYQNFLEESFTQVCRITKDNGFICITNTDRREKGGIFAKHIKVYQIMVKNGWRIKEYKILVKNNPEAVDLWRLTYSHIILYTKTGVIKNKDYEFMKDLWIFQMPKNKNLWPFDFPERIIKNCTTENDLVFDPFAGRGTALTVAKRLGRNYLGFEILPELHKYFYIQNV
jgi:DNA modification methylase